MAESPTHRFGQIIGDVLESAVEPLLREFAERQELYLDRRGPRPARRGAKVTWVDKYSNPHDLDFVLERGGTSERIGAPVAFIEPAYRRYTKHSRNKAQEIQGAILLLADTHRLVAPFLGAILAGVFTEGAITQLRSLGFRVLYIPNDLIVRAFDTVGIDARFDEATPDDEVALKVEAWDVLPADQRIRVARELLSMASEQVADFMMALERSVTRQVTRVRVLPLHGASIELSSVEEAIEYIGAYGQSTSTLHLPFARYEVEVRFTSGDRIEGQFANKDDAVAFLASFRLPQISPGQA